VKENSVEFPKDSMDMLHKAFDLSDEKYSDMDETEFRARVRERGHHTLEIQTYAAIHKHELLREKQPDTLRRLVGIWKKRGISTDAADFQTSVKLLDLAEQASKSEDVDLSQYAPRPISPTELEAFDAIVKERRSIRHWTDEDIPDELIDRIITAATWAAHSCNLQSLRFVVIREKTTPNLFLGADIPGGPVHILFLQDMRAYLANPLNPERNRLLDVGAAAQNAVLMAHALGLGGVWLTFTDVVKKRLDDFLELPEYIVPITYIDLGWPAQTPFPLGRTGLEEVVLKRA
jgi:nitroreductase